MFDALNKDLLRRAAGFARLVEPVLYDHPYYLAGGCFSDEIIDIDVFGCFSRSTLDTVKKNSPNKIYESARALTICNDKYPIQLIKEKYDNLEDLVNGIDFAHCQVGVEVNRNGIQRVFYTQNFLEARLLNTTFYCSSSYPLASLTRLFKFYKRDKLSKNEMIRSLAVILTDLVDRGFDSVADLKKEVRKISGSDPDGELVSDVHDVNLWKPLYAALNKRKNSPSAKPDPF